MQKIKINKNRIVILSLLIALVILGSLSVSLYRKAGASKGVLSSQEAAQKALVFINNNLSNQGKKASLENVIDKGQIYEFSIKIGDKKYISYVTKDGKFLFPQGYQISSTKSQEASASKRKKPDVKLFVMSYCPYGLQTEKMFLPVYNLLKADASMGIYFVDYIMHGKKELDENLRQYCIQKEENDKYPSYLSCFVYSGDYKSCLSKAEIDKQEIDLCVTNTDKKYHITEDYNNKSTWLNGTYPVFNIYKDLNNKYNVQGSPTIVINDTPVNISSRSPEAFKEAICKAFETEPKACSQKLSTTVPSPGIGGGTGSSSSEGSCK